MPALTQAVFTVVSTSLTTAAAWNAEYTGTPTVTGTGANVLATSPTLVTPALGTPSAIVLTSGTGLPISTGVSGLGTGVATFLATPTSANLKTAVATTNTGSGALVFGTSPTFTTSLLVAGTTSGTTTIQATATASGTLTLPAATDTLVGKATTDTLTNKTLTAPISTLSINTQTGTTFTPALSDAASLVTLNNAAAIAVTIPTNASVAYAIGSQLNFVWITGAGQPTISAVTPGTTTIISTGATAASPKLRVVNSVATALKIATDIWLVTGDIA